MMDERLSSSILRKTISEPQDSDGELRCKFDICVPPEWQPQYVNNVIGEICIFKMWEIRSSEGCGFDPRLGLRYRFSENKA